MHRLGRNISGRLLPALAILLMTAVCSCHRQPIFEDSDKLFLIYSAGHNNLRGDLETNIRTLSRNLPRKSTIIVYSHGSNNSYSPAPSHIIHVRSVVGGSVLFDTLTTYPSSVSSTSPQTLKSVLEYVFKRYPRKEEYGMLFSSHGTGFLPEGYYTHSSILEQDYAGKNNIQRQQKTIGADYYYKDDYPGGPGEVPDYKVVDKTKYEEVMDIRDLADAIPHKLDYIILDACLMGGIEVAYQLRDKASYLIASPAEILSTGMDYKNMAGRIFSDGSLSTRLKDVCVDYYNLYKDKPGDYCSTTISLINLDKIEYLQVQCSKIFNKYQENIASLQDAGIQQYYTRAHHWFYDLYDIVDHLGCQGNERAALKNALNTVVIYKAATPKFLPNNGGFVINTYSGLSMYLPSSGGEYLNDYYRTLDWNIDTNLIPDTQK